ncbi:protein DPCD-like isoform X1 [Sycon ciliatum]|uniref:protein DPCD-like isoform X1 n=1 Tax=Sycon ciliatum TaxID=27933 RepID=UPI0031F65A10
MDTSGGSLASSSWVSSVKQARKTAMMQDGHIRVHFVFADGLEMSEGYDAKTQELLVRKLKSRPRLGGEGNWEWEVGEESMYERARKAQASSSSQFLVESSSTPFITRRDKLKSFEWRIRNLPYPSDVYSVTAEAEQAVLVIRTSNKKYFKRITVTDLQRLGCWTENEAISFAHANNTLIISYKKPRAVLELQQAVFLEVKGLLKGMKDGDVNCSQS